MATEYKTIYARKPGGVLPFTVNEKDGLLNVYPTEIFCRYKEIDGSMCVNTTKFDSANALRLHIKNKHGANKCSGFVKPSQVVMAAANKEFKECHEAVVAYDKQLRAAAAEHLDIVGGSTSKKRKRNQREKNIKDKEVDGEEEEDDSQLRKSKNKNPPKNPPKKPQTKPTAPPTGPSTPPPTGEERRKHGEKTVGPRDIREKFEASKFTKVVKGVTTYNHTAMRKAAGVKTSKCKFCTNSKSAPCPPTEIDDWEKHGCNVLARFIQPED